MALRLTLRYETRKANLWFVRLRIVATRIPAVFLLGSLLVAQAAAQDTADSNVGQDSRAQPTVSSQGAPKVSEKPKKVSKYDVDRIGQRGIGKGVNGYSLEEERELGRQLSGQLETMTKLIPDPVIMGYVDRLGQRIVRHSDAQVPFIIKVVQSDEISALAFPGGYLYVNSGLILAADSEAELAGLMAHEVAHIAARHATRAETRMQIWNVLSIVLTYIGGPAGAALRGVVGVAAPASFMKFTRDAEREADLLGLEYEYAAGYDPQAFVQFFEKLHSKENHKRRFIARAFAAYPMTEDRIKRAQQAISTLLPAKSEYIVDTNEFQEVKSRLAYVMHEHVPSDAGRPVLHRRTREDDNAGGLSKKWDGAGRLASLTTGSE